MKHEKLMAAVLSLLLLGGCSLVPFLTPEEQRAQQEAIEAARAEALAEADPHAALETDLRLHRKLTNSVGVTLAEYQVSFPYFSKKGSKAQSFARVNEYYKGELAGLGQDAESFFADVKRSIGENWDTVPGVPAVARVLIDYELLDAPQGFLSVRCDFTITEGGQTESYSKGQVFLMDNGWALPLHVLFGEDYERASGMLLTDLLKWCTGHEVEVSGRENRTIDEFAQDYALTEDGFIFFTEPFQLSNQDPNRYQIVVPLTRYRTMLDL